MEIILASASSRRQQLLDQINIRYHVMPVDVDESAQKDESHIKLVQRLACLKAETAWQQSDKTRPVLGADTLGVIGDSLLVKPIDYHDAHRMLSQMANNWHDIVTAIALYSPQGVQTALSVSRVQFRAIATDEIKAYWYSGEPQDKAGAYAIQGQGAVFVKRIEGSYSGIMGLPLYETHQLLQSIPVNNA